MSDLFRPTKIVTGTRRVPVRPPRTVRPPTEPGQASITSLFRGGVQSTSSAGDITVTLPSAPAGDLFVVCLAGSGDPSGTFTVSTGWTQRASVQNSGGSGRNQTEVWTKIADGTEGGSLTVSHSDGHDSGIAWISMAIRPNGVDYTTATFTASTLGTGSIDPPSVSPSAGEYLVFSFWGFNKVAGSQPSGYTVIDTLDPIISSGAATQGIYGAYKRVDITTSEDPGTWTVADPPGTAGSIVTLITFAVPSGSEADVSAPGHTHEDEDIDSEAATDGHVLTADGAGGAAWEAPSAGSHDTLSDVSIDDHHARDHAATHADGGVDELDVSDLASGAATDGWVATADGAGGVAWEAVPAGGSVAIDDLTDVTITTPSDGQVLTYDSGTSEWVNEDASGGGSSTVPEWMERLASPDSAHADDDEFDDASLTGWTAVNASGSATPTWTEDHGLLSVKIPSGDGAADMHAQVKAVTLSTGDYIETAVRIHAQDGGFPHIGLVMADGASAGSGQQVFGGSSSQAFQLNCYDWSGYDTRDATTQFITYEHTGLASGLHYFRLYYVAANSFRAELSPDGKSWIATANASITCTPTHAGIVIMGWSASQVAASFEYFRRG